MKGIPLRRSAGILKKNTNTVYTLLARARQLLKTRLEGVIEDE